MQINNDKQPNRKVQGIWTRHSQRDYMYIFSNSPSKDVLILFPESVNVALYGTKDMHMWLFQRFWDEEIILDQPSEPAVIPSLYNPINFSILQIYFLKILEARSPKSVLLGWCICRQGGFRFVVSMVKSVSLTSFPISVGHLRSLAHDPFFRSFPLLLLSRPLSPLILLPPSYWEKPRRWCMQSIFDWHIVGN